jgi:hypothetical protein
MRELRARTNATIEEVLEAAPIFDPASLDALPANALPPAWWMLVDEAMAPDDGRVRFYMPWEVIL